MPPGAYDEERMPFEQVLRKLISAKPTHKTAVESIKRNAKNSPKKV